MQELRFVAVSEDGSYAVLAVPGRSGRYILPIDERLRAVALGQTSRLAQYEIEVESPLRPKEIQARIRAGETAEEIADAAGIPVERVRWFEGPVLAERAYIADQAQLGSVRRAGDASGPGRRLGEVVTERLSAAGTDTADGEWDARKRGDGNWQVSLTFPSGGRLHVAEWVFDPRRRHVMPDDDNAARLSLPESELPPEPVPQPGEATVTPIASRLGAAAGMGGGIVGSTGSGFPGASRFRPDKSVIPDRSLGVDRSLIERPAAMPDRSATAVADRAAVSDRAAAAERPSPPAPPRPGQQDRPAAADRPANPGYAEFPESAPYRAPEPEPAPERLAREAAPEPRSYRDPVGFRAPAAERPAPAGYREQGAGVPVGTPDQTAEAAPAAGFEESERVGVSPPRPVVFEDPEPTYLDEQLELSSEVTAGTPETDEAPAAPSATRATPGAAPAPGVAEPVAHELADLPPTPAPEAQAARQQEPHGPAPVAAPAARAATTEPETAAAPEAEPAATAAAASTQADTPAEAATPAEATAKAEPDEAPTARRPGSKKNAKARRSSVPSWDEIMLGSSRPRD